MDMVERVARAMHAGRDDSVTQGWDDMPSSYREKSLELVRLGIEAMREPTKAMCFVNGPGDQHNYADAEARETWRKMIDTALAGK